jgi:predicted glycoside hydrolase/deacetylase ChbG (UPF0249 family)
MIGRRLIVNADDFGLSPGVNKGIIEAHTFGIVTSSSLMVRWPAASEAAMLAQSFPNLSVGIHIDLAEWAFRGGSWTALYEVVPTDDERAIAVEISRQIEKFREHMGRDPTHIDSHQHVHKNEPTGSVVSSFASQMDIPVRGCGSKVGYCGAFYGQTSEGAPLHDNITVQALISVLKDLPSGYTELGCHPGYGGDLDTMYRNEREQEIRALCDPLVRDSIREMGIELCSFGDVKDQ